MRPVPRKNWRGFIPHIWSMLEILIRSGEFPRIRKNISTREFIGTKRGLRMKERLSIGFGDIHPISGVNNNHLENTLGSAIDNSMAFAGGFGEKCDLERDKRIDLTFILHEKWLKLDDEEINRYLRHELLHYELGKGDHDIEFIEECLERDLSINISSNKVLYAHRVSQNYRFKFDRELFDYCFPEGFEYWATFAKHMNLFHINLEDIIPTSPIWTRKMLRVIFSDDQMQGAENLNPTGGIMKNEKCFTARQIRKTNHDKGGEQNFRHPSSNSQRLG